MLKDICKDVINLIFNYYDVIEILKNIIQSKNIDMFYLKILIRYPIYCAKIENSKTIKSLKLLNYKKIKKFVIHGYNENNNILSNFLKKLSYLKQFYCSNSQICYLPKNLKKIILENVNLVLPSHREQLISIKM